MWKRLRGRRSSQFILALVFLGIPVVWVWTYAYPPGFQSCRESETRNLLVQALNEKGLRVECRKENRDTVLMVQFPLRNFQQFSDWALTQRIGTIYEQPGYFWFLRTDSIPGFVTYEF